MINVFEGIVRQDVFGENGEFEQLLSQTEQDISQPGSSPAVDISEADAALGIDSLESSCDDIRLLELKATSTPKGNISETSTGVLDNKQSEHGLGLGTTIAHKMLAKPAEYPVIKLDKASWQTSVPALIKPLTEKSSASSTILKDSSNISSVMTTRIDSKPEISRTLANDTYLQKPFLGPMQHGDVKNHSSLLSSKSMPMRGGELETKVKNPAITLDPSAQNRTELKFTDRNFAFNRGTIRPSHHADNNELSGKVVNVHNKHLVSSPSEVSLATERVSSISSLMKPVPLTEMSFPNYQLDPELFWQHPRVNSYVVMYRSKYYLFEFDEHKMINYLEYSDDRN
ncbi:hypothetical protein [Vibrio hepatarius]|uniref:hypothetical protein n=1 Tax=Vibrio hepatarius TaxID=171383 RepID=UPI001C08404C|nr:hypothetical protein [Vibrio hepatarius]MBU2895896.1 hypothetical protein [Vibrio hepatarius]